MLGKAVVPDDLPYVTGSVGWLGTAASTRMMRECDTLIMVGTNFPYTEFLPEPGNARGVQIDVEPRNLALRYPNDVPIIGDAADVLRRLLPMLENSREKSWQPEIEGWANDSWQAAERHAHASAHPVNPQRVVWELGTRLPDDAILTADSGTSAVWLARCIRIRRGMMSSLSGGLATMGCAIPYALAAKLAHPGRPAYVRGSCGSGALVGASGFRSAWP